MKLYKVKNDTNTLIKNELLTIEKIEKHNYNLKLFDEIDIPKSLVFFNFGAWFTSPYFKNNIGYYAFSYPKIIVTNIIDTWEGYDVYFVVNDYFYRKRKLHIDYTGKDYFYYYGNKYYLNDFMRF